MDENKEISVTRKLTFMFKAVKEQCAPDKYEEILCINRIPCVVIPVLSFEFVNNDTLASLLSNLKKWSAIILTSTRSVEAVVAALRDLYLSEEVKAVMQCFVVGQATHDAALAAGFQPEGSEAGNADALAEYILTNIKDTSRPLLFPCSNIRRETIPQVLKSKGLQISEVIVYETCPDDHIEDYIRKAVAKKGLPEFAVFFSPSGFKYLHTSCNEILSFLQHSKMIALGPATEAAIRSHGYEVWGTAEKPDPESVLHLLQTSSMPRKHQTECDMKEENKCREMNM